MPENTFFSDLNIVAVLVLYLYDPGLHLVQRLALEGEKVPLEQK